MSSVRFEGSACIGAINQAAYDLLQQVHRQDDAANLRGLQALASLWRVFEADNLRHRIADCRRNPYCPINQRLLPDLLARLAEITRVEEGK